MGSVRDICSCVSECASTSSVHARPSVSTCSLHLHAHTRTHACTSVTSVMHDFAGSGDGESRHKSRVSSHSVSAKPWHSRFVFHLKKVGERRSSLASRLLANAHFSGMRDVHYCVPLPVLYFRYSSFPRKFALNVVTCCR